MYSTQKRILKASAFAILAIAFALLGGPLSQVSASESQPRGRGGGGVGISVNIGGIIDAIQRSQQQKPKPTAKPTRTNNPCGRNEVWSSRSRTCVCTRGYVAHGDGCHKPPQQARQPEPEPEVDIELVQTCLVKIGFDAGAPDGQIGPMTRIAWRNFQTVNKIKPNADFDDRRTLTVLFDLCQKGPDQPVIAAATPIPVSTAPADPTRSLTPVSPAPAPQRCLPQDLYDLLARTYGRQPAVGPCPPRTACLPKPVTYSQARLDQATRDRGVTWCENCVQLGTWLPLSAVLTIEAAANVTLCASPLACYLPSRPATHTRTEIRTVFRGLPRSVGNDGDVAVVVGNETYRAAIPNNANANNDANSVRALLVEQLGFQDKNIIDLRDASLAELERVFGGKDGSPGELSGRFGKDKQGELFIYVSSHGMAQETSKQAYILPVDANTDQLDATAYGLQQLYANLGKVGARNVMVLLEADFARNVGALIDPPNLPELEVNAMPQAPIPGLAVFKASDRDQRTLEDPEFGIGLFTRYLIEGLAGKADAAPIGNGDSRIDAVELFVYTADLVRTAARKSHGVEQKPLLSDIGNLVVGQLAH